VKVEFWIEIDSEEFMCDYDTGYWIFEAFRKLPIANVYESDISVEVEIRI
jgi:hypothetical protein